MKTGGGGDCVVGVDEGGFTSKVLLCITGEGERGVGVGVDGGVCGEVRGLVCPNGCCFLIRFTFVSSVP